MHPRPSAQQIARLLHTAERAPHKNKNKNTQPHRRPIAASRVQRTPPAKTPPTATKTEQITQWNAPQPGRARHRMTRPRQCLLSLLIWGVDGLADEIVRLCENKPKERDGVKKRDAPRAQGRKQKRRYPQHTATIETHAPDSNTGKSRMASAEWICKTVTQAPLR